jgi:hypothetical protein
LFALKGATIGQKIQIILFLRKMKRTISFKSLSLFVLGAALTALFFFGLELENQNNFLDRIINRIDDETASPDHALQQEAFIKEAVHYTYYLLQRRSEFFDLAGGEEPLKERLMPSPIRASIDGYGSCGGYSNFLMALLKRKG